MKERTLIDIGSIIISPSIPCVRCLELELKKIGALRGSLKLLIVLFTKSLLRDINRN